PLRVDHVRAITDAAIRTSDLVIMDLPSAATDVNREVLCKADLVAMVIEREPSAIASARAMMALFQTWGVRVPIGSVIISRINIPEATSAAEINSQLGLKKYGVIPPGPGNLPQVRRNPPARDSRPPRPSGRTSDGRAGAVPSAGSLSSRVAGSLSSRATGSPSS